ncbi:MAG TPA: sugar phosphate isomerase/epimerase [Microbacterium sp.]|uniref:sugar phosphate isomerase/epimerase family protein n=1 Tax=Microbacterium sp. TaxID=51671 RepID=UPI002B473925|nr:sugar phosphate isomerase/epimerase [Microbacterium sp.]HKT57265.1 sugar phosphate isomerase/epimerase [Microbacterium sp.]
MSSPSVQLYSVRDAIGENIDAALARLAEIGFTKAEPYGFHTNTGDVKRALTAAGISAPSGHASVIDNATPEAVFDAAAELGIRTVIDPFVPTDRWQTADDVAKIAARVNELSAQAQERGLEFGYHNHQWEFTNKVGGRTVFELFAAQLDPAVVLEVDTFWATVGGADVPAVLRALGDRVRAIHVKDGLIDDAIRDILPSSESALIVPEALTAAFENQQPAGQGDVDVTAILAAAPQALRVVEFDRFRGDVFEGIAASFAWLAANDVEAAA